MYLAQHPATGRPAEALAQAVEKPEAREDSHSGGPGEDHIDATHREQTNGEKPAGADLVWQHAADELADSIGQRLTAGDHAWTKGGVERRNVHRADARVADETLKNANREHCLVKRQKWLEGAANNLSQCCKFGKGQAHAGWIMHFRDRPDSDISPGAHHLHNVL